MDKYLIFDTSKQRYLCLQGYPTAADYLHATVYTLDQANSLAASRNNLTVVKAPADHPLIIQAKANAYRRLGRLMSNALYNIAHSMRCQEFFGESDTETIKSLYKEFDELEKKYRE